MSRRTLLVLLLLLLLLTTTAAAVVVSTTTNDDNGNDKKDDKPQPQPQQLQLQQDGHHRLRALRSRRRRNRHPTGLVRVASTRSSFEETYDTLIQTLEDNPNLRIVAEVDHAQAAESVGLELERNRLVVFGNPALGTPLMEHRLEAGLDLPQKMLVWEDEDEEVVWVGYNLPAYVVARFKGNPRQVATLETMTNALRSIAATAAGVDPSMVDGDDTVLFGRQELRKARGRWHKVRSQDDDFDATWNRLVAAIEASPANIAFEVNHGANAPNGELNPSRLLVFGNPNLGTPLMQKAPTAGIDLPLKILVTQNAKGRVWVYTNSIRFLTWRHGLGKKLDLSNMAAAIANFVEKATTVAPPET